MNGIQTTKYYLHKIDQTRNNSDNFINSFFDTVHLALLMKEIACHWAFLQPFFYFILNSLPIPNIFIQIYFLSTYFQFTVQSTCFNPHITRYITYFQFLYFFLIHTANPYIFQLFRLPFLKIYLDITSFHFHHISLCLITFFSFLLIASLLHNSSLPT